jgi:hypothetical protein
MSKGGQTRPLIRGSVTEVTLTAKSLMPAIELQPNDLDRRPFARWADDFPKISLRWCAVSQST